MIRAAAGILATIRSINSLFFIIIIVCNFSSVFSQSFPDECVSLKNKASQVRLIAPEKTTLAECYFQNRELPASARLYLELLDNDETFSKRALARLLDIYRLGETSFNRERPIAMILKDRSQIYLARQWMPLLLQNNNIPDFIRLFEQYPISLNESQWSQLAVVTDLPKYTALLKQSGLNELQIKFYQATYYHTYQEYDKAHACLDFILERKLDTDALQKKISFLYREGRQNEAQKYLAQLREIGDFGRRIIADFYFQNGDVKKALSEIRDGIQNGGKLHDQEIFYLMADSEASESSYLLEKYFKLNLIPQFRYMSLKNEILKSAGEKEYYAGMQKLKPEFPEICKESINLMLNWASDAEIHNEIDKCTALQDEGNRMSLAAALSLARRHTVLQQYLLGRENLQAAEKIILLKSLVDFEQETVTIAARPKPPFNSWQEQYCYELLQVPLYSNNNEVKLLAAKIAFQNQNFSEALQMLKNNTMLEAIKLHQRLLFLTDNFEQLFVEIRRYPAEYNFHSALIELNKGNEKTAEELLEKYLETPGSYGNQAVYLTFLLKQYREIDGVRELCLAIARFPDGMRESDWAKFNQLLEKENEVAAILGYWKGRWLLQKGNTQEGVLILTKIRSQDTSAILHPEIDYLLSLQNKKDKQDYLNKFPESPYRLYLAD